MSSLGDGLEIRVGEIVPLRLQQILDDASPGGLVGKRDQKTLDEASTSRFVQLLGTVGRA